MLAAQTHLLCRSEHNSFAGCWLGSSRFTPPLPPSPLYPMTACEVLWGLGANELTLQCWSRCSVTQGESEEGAGGDVRGAIMNEPHRVRRDSNAPVRQSASSAELNASFKMTPQCWPSRLYLFPFMSTLFLADFISRNWGQRKGAGAHIKASGVMDCMDTLLVYVISFE